MAMTITKLRRRPQAISTIVVAGRRIAVEHRRLPARRKGGRR
jgi:hypothetical protein